MNTTIERRFRLAEVRADGSARAIGGRAASYNVRTNVGDMWIEVLAPGAFAKAVRERTDVRLLQDHDPSRVLARTKSGTLTLKDSAAGLDFNADVAPTTVGDDVLKLIRRGDLDGCSFSFQIPSASDEVWSDTVDEASGQRMPLRTIKNLALFDVSVVTFPQYTNTSVQADGRATQKRDDECDCDCQECQDGDCADCSNPDCDDENCRCMERSARLARMFPISAPGRAPLELRSRIAKAIQIRSRIKTGPAGNVTSKSHSGIPANLTDEEYLLRLRARDALSRLDKFSL